MCCVLENVFECVCQHHVLTHTCDQFPSSCHWSGISDEIFFKLKTQGDCIIHLMLSLKKCTSDIHFIQYSFLSF